MNKPVEKLIVTTNEAADWCDTVCTRLAIFTHEPNKQLQQQDEDDETRDPEQSNGSFVAEFIIEGIAEVGEVQQAKHHQ